MTRFARLATIALALGACHPRVPPEDVPALLTDPGERVRAQLAAVVSGALGGAPITIADRALTTDDVLIVERTQRRDEQGRDLDGRQPGRPEHFRLVKTGSSCVLVHERTGRRWTLDAATCSPRHPPR